ncbi:MAG: phosphatase PAP2 family protein [Paludibacter sp.]|nr:phosphatase PAP2 family protein [Paludibacter sp.]
MNLIDTLNLWDTHLFLFLNGLNSTFFDGFMFAVSAKLTWVPLYLAVLFVIIKEWKKESIWIVISLVFCVVIADQISSGLIKEMVQRPRPSHAENLQGMVHLVNGYVGGKYGFVSSHAANAFGFALLTSLLFRRNYYTYVIFGWASITAYSRIYLGVHYPLDILGGILVGILAALTCFFAIKKLRPSLLQMQDNDSNNENLNVTIPLITIGLSFVGIVIYSLFFF